LEDSRFLATLRIDAPAPVAPSADGQEAHFDARGPKPRPSVGESIVRGALANFSAQPLTWGASFLAAAFVPRMLGSDAFGQLTIAFTITSLATPLLDLGVASYFTRRVAQHPEKIRRDLGVALIVQVAMFGLGALAIVLVTPLVAPSLLDFRILDMAAVVLVVSCVQSMLTSALRGREQHVLFAWLSASIPVVSTVGTVLILFAGGDVLAYTACGMVLTIICVAGSWWISRLRVQWSSLRVGLLDDARAFIRGGFPFLSWNLTMTLYGGIDRLLLAFFVPVSEVGWYAAAFRIIGVPVFVPTLLITPLYPVLSRSAHEPDTLRRAIAQTLRITLLFMVPLSAGLFVVAPLVPSLLGWPADFAGSIPLMMILSTQVPIVGVDMVLGTVIMAIGRERSWVRIGLLAAVVNIGCNLALIPFFEHVSGNGPIGASIVTVLTEIWMFVGSVIVIPRHLLDPKSLGSAARIILASAAAAFAATALLAVSLIAAAVVGAVIYVTLVLVLRAASVDDIEYVKQRLLRRAR
jgi:O-antigen/teichoic acid export membrane protein